MSETERRSWLQRVPELAFCVIVPDEQWPQAQHTLQTAQPSLETPVVIFARREIQNGIAARGWSPGPTSDAYFQQEAGNRELLDRKERRQRLEDQINTLHHETVHLRCSLQRLNHTLTHYPPTWWNEHHALLREAQEQQQSSQAKLRPQEIEFSLFLLKTTCLPVSTQTMLYSYTPATFKAVPQSLNVIVPQQAPEELFSKEC